MAENSPPDRLRRDGRRNDDLRPITVQRHFTRMTPGSVLIQAGGTVILCTATVDETLPPWMANQDRGWVTAEYSMLPGSTSPRKGRDRGGKIDGRTTEIQRLIGRSLRSVVNLQALGRRQVTVDCDVLQADGGTRTLSITGGWIALADAIASVAPAGVDPSAVLQSNVAAISVGLIDGELMLDLDYSEDSRAQVDTNVVMTGAGEFVEIQGTAEGRPFTQAQLDSQLLLARRGIEQLTAIQQNALRTA